MSDKSKTNLVPNVKVKVEPGTSMPVPLKNIKTEPGLPVNTTRLTSFRLPRDLTLGGNVKTEKMKKVYTPNLNAQRNKKKDDGPQPKIDTPKGERGRGRGRGRGERGRGKQNNHIQSTGIFSQGASETPGHRRSYEGSRDRDSQIQKSLEKPKLDLNRTIDQDEEKKKIELLLRDDFIDDGFEPNLDNAPILLPLGAKLYKTESKAEEADSDNEIEDKKPVILENGEVKPSKMEIKTNMPGSKDTKEDITIPQIIENKTPSYILMQFPDCLPGIESSNDNSSGPTKHSHEQNAERENDKQKTEFCTLNSLKGGLLGKLQILKSGKARLCLGENNLIVDVGSVLSFRQDLVAAKLDTAELTGDLINLGPVSSTFICSPDWESMLTKFNI